MPGEPVNWFALVPGYAEAVEREITVREQSFLDLTQDICGIEVRPMTPLDLLLLHGSRSPFVVGGPVTAEEIVKFLWVLSPEFRFVRSWRDRWARYRFIKRCRKLNADSALLGIDKYLADTLQDAPGSRSGSGKVSDWSWIAALVDQIASTYHWSEDDILRTPLARLFQYSRICVRREDDKAIFFNRRDTVRGEWLRQQNGHSAVN